ncbi:unnamed protein product [Pleuronectes platessa]|uniref:Uncharacterized protein n=1 Tax=Pleuronectes platessa TaxID=8262 RepID=A0A9N7TPX3_PLEPL|nr:unnamed protein product [Pleuronectes platessa]
MTVVVVRDFKKIQTSTVVLERLCEWKEKLSSHTPPVQPSHMVQLKTLQRRRGDVEKELEGKTFAEKEAQSVSEEPPWFQVKQGRAKQKHSSRRGKSCGVTEPVQIRVKRDRPTDGHVRKADRPTDSQTKPKRQPSLGHGDSWSDTAIRSGAPAPAARLERRRLKAEEMNPCLRQHTLPSTHPCLSSASLKHEKGRLAGDAACLSSKLS